MTTGSVVCWGQSVNINSVSLRVDFIKGTIPYSIMYGPVHSVWAKVRHHSVSDNAHSVLRRQLEARCD